MHTASWTRIRIEAALLLTTAAEEPRCRMDTVHGQRFPDKGEDRLGLLPGRLEQVASGEVETS